MTIRRFFARLIGLETCKRCRRVIPRLQALEFDRLCVHCQIEEREEELRQLKAEE